MRRLLVLAMLLVGMHLIAPLGGRGQGSVALLAFGFLILAAHTVGELAHSVRLPRVVGYLAAGIAFGPYVLGTVPLEGVERLAPVSNLAVALIAFLAGAELRLEELRKRGVMLLKVTVTELTFGFVALAGTLYLLRGYLPILRSSPDAEALAFSLLFAAVAIVHSPAVTMALLTETRARGPVARTTLGVVLIADIVVVLLFSVVLAVVRSISPPTGGAPGFAEVLWEIGGAVLIGAGLGLAVAQYLRHVGRELIFFALLVAFFGVELARLTHVELLLTMLAAGFVTENFSREGDGARLLQAMERSAAPVFVVFFALAGAKVDVAQVAQLLPLVVPLALVRAFAIRGGVAVGGRWGGLPARERGPVAMGLVSQAGVAIGLASIVAAAYPQRGATLAALLLALIAVNESIGPILFRRALVTSGEVDPAAEVEGEEPAPVGAH